MGEIIDCKIIRQEMTQGLIDEVNDLKYSPVLSIVQVGDHAASNTYIRNKVNYAEQVGIKAKLVKLDENITKADLISKVVEESMICNGLIVQLPLPGHLRECEQEILDVIPLTVDVDGLSSASMGRLVLGKPLYVPCTVQACIDVLDHVGCDMTGKDVLVVGRSNIVGKPLALELTRRNATVTLGHSKSRYLPGRMSVNDFDVVVSAIGVANNFDYINARVIIDVGINRDSENKLCGDIDLKYCEYEYATTVGGGIGGVGQLTVYNLMKNTVKAYRLQTGLDYGV